MKSPQTEKARLDKVTVRPSAEVAGGIERSVEKLRQARGRVPGALAGERPLRPEARLLRDRQGARRCARSPSTRSRRSRRRCKMMSLSKELVETNDFATKRDAYYQSQELGRGAVRRADASPTR